MRIVVDTNIVFSAVLNTDSHISRIFLYSKSKLNFYSTLQLLTELEENKGKLIKISKYTEPQLLRVTELITQRIRFINPALIPKSIYNKAESLTADVDIDDTEFIALSEHMKAKFWSGDKALIKGLKQKGWNRFIETQELFKLVAKK
ncbi:MAG TPA: PIN domain-containing protein [Cyclobacteriaceae bacterium]|nr:PIN domain-containing protein [Cyclobacteriaceae bacterium]